MTGHDWCYVKNANLVLVHFSGLTFATNPVVKVLELCSEVWWFDFQHWQCCGVSWKIASLLLSFVCFAAASFKLLTQSCNYEKFCLEPNWGADPVNEAVTSCFIRSQTNSQTSVSFFFLTRRHLTSPLPSVFSSINPSLSSSSYLSQPTVPFPLHG